VSDQCSRTNFRIERSVLSIASRIEAWRQFDHGHDCTYAILSRHRAIGYGAMLQNAHAASINRRSCVSLCDRSPSHKSAAA
jgi:hypothetical protein